jgi:hypothetical protein
MADASSLNASNVHSCKHATPGFNSRKAATTLETPLLQRFTLNVTSRSFIASGRGHCLWGREATEGKGEKGCMKRKGGEGRETFN